MTKKQKAAEIIKLLKKEYPEVKCALNYSKPHELLIATRLSAQCTDKRVNLVTPELFKRFPEIADYANAEVSEIEKYIESCGLFRTKAKDISLVCVMLHEKYNDVIPDTVEELVKLPGVGRKTANLILGDVFKIPGSTVVDTHCIRISNRLGLVDDLKDPVKIEHELRKILPPEHSSDFCHCIVLHGRAVCDARKPDCAHCCVKHLCKSFSG